MLRTLVHRAFFLLLLGSRLVLAGEDEWRAHMQAGEAAQKRGDSAAATTSFDAALREAEGFGPQDRRLAETLSRVAANQQAQGRLAEAESHYRRALAIHEATDGPDHFEVGRILNSIAVNYLRRGRFAEAEPLLERAISIAEKVSGPDHLSVATGLNSLGQLKYRQGRYAEAEAFHLRALAIREKARGPEHLLLVADLGSLAALYFKTGDLAKAEAFSARLLALREKLLGPEHADVAKNLNQLADVRRAQGRFDAAEPLYLRALRILKSKSSVVAQTDAATVQLKLDELQRMQGRSAEPPQPQQPMAKTPAQDSYRPSQTELEALVQCEQAVLGEMDKDTKIRSGTYDVVHGRWLIVGKGAEEIIRCLAASHGWIALNARDGRRVAQAPRFRGRNDEAPQLQQPVAKTPAQEPPALARENTATDPAAARIWERAHYELTIQTAKQAKERGETTEAERLCFLAITYVGARTVSVLEDYAALLATMNRAGALDAKERAEKLKDQRLRREWGSVYLGFEPAGELMTYARLLRELARSAEADAVIALADAEKQVHFVNFLRNVLLARGDDPWGVCSVDGTTSIRVR